MPVWHELTKELREAGELQVVGITQEQHAERCQLWAQWQQIDWPILWDPYNRTGSSAVPIAMAVDEYGVIRNMRLHPRKFETQFVRDFMQKQFPAPAISERRKIAEHPQWRQLIPELQKLLQSDSENATAWFRLGVALRMRFDQNDATMQADDFQQAVNCWSRALKLKPSQYIWRRRIQQWGPKLDKPYPFYDWVIEAQQQIRERGEAPISLPIRVFPAAVPSGDGSEAVARNAFNDNDGMVPRDADQAVAIQHAWVPNTQKPKDGAGATARLHLLLRPDATREVHWGWDGGPVQIWMYDAEGWKIQQDYFRLEPQTEVDAQGKHIPLPNMDGSTQGVNFELQRTSGDAATELTGVAYYYICIGESGECTFLAQDFRIPLPTTKSAEANGDE